MADARVGQQGTLTRIWVPRDSRPRAPRGTSAYIFGPVCPEGEATAALVMPHADTAAMNAHLAEISRTVAVGAHAILVLVILVLDGASWHGSRALRVPNNITLLPLPPYAPELNPIENVWAYLRANRLAICVFEPCEDIVARCCDAWTSFANDSATVRSITTREYAETVKGQGRWYDGRFARIGIVSRSNSGHVLLEQFHCCSYLPILCPPVATERFCQF